MVLRYVEGFEGWDTTTLKNARYSVVATAGTAAQLTVNATAGRDGNRAFKTTSNASGYIVLPGTDTPEAYIGFAWKPETIFHNVTTPLVVFMTGASEAVRVSCAQDGTCQLTTGNTTRQTEGFFNLNVWQYVEVYVLVSDTVGVVTVKVNGVTIHSFGPGDTKTSAVDENIESIRLGYGTNLTTSNVTTLDDIYVCDETGAKNNDFLGDVKVQVLRPNGNGTTNNFTGSDADSTDNYLHVDESPPHDGDTSYVQSQTVGHKDLYAYSNVPVATSLIHGAQVNSILKKTDSGTREVVHVARSVATESDSSDLGVGIDYFGEYTVYEDDPDAAAAWTDSTLNAAEFGVKVTA
jgi:hypothetical protein